MEGDAEPNHREQDEQARTQPPPETAASPRLTGTPAQPNPPQPPEMESRPDRRVNHPDRAEAPPPYSPPDLKAFPLWYPTFQTHIPGQGTVFCQPAPLGHQPSAIPGSYPFTIYNGSLFSEIPLESEREPPPKDYTVESVLVTIFCCFVTGVIALVFSYETQAALNRGDLVQATSASRKARLFVLISLFFGVAASFSWVVYVVVTLYL